MGSISSKFRLDIGSDKPFINQLQAAGGNLMALAGATHNPAPAFGDQTRLLTILFEPVRKTAVHARDSKPDWLLLNLLQWRKLWQAQLVLIHQIMCPAADDSMEVFLHQG